MEKKKYSNEKELSKTNRLRRHLGKIQMRVFRKEKINVDDGAKSAITIQDAFNQLSEFKLNAIGTEVTTGYVEGLIPSSPDLDFEVLLDNKRIAELDTTGSNYTFAGSKIMPVRCYKGEKVKKLKLPIFMLYWMKNEHGLVKDCCYWIKGADVLKCPTSILRTKYKYQDNYMTNKADWHRGLESLIEELRFQTDKQMLIAK